MCVQNRRTGFPWLRCNEQRPQGRPEEGRSHSSDAQPNGCGSSAPISMDDHVLRVVPTSTLLRHGAISRLTRQYCEWEWAHEQDTPMAELNKLVTSVPLLAYYDPSKELVIRCDASSTGLGFTLMQAGIRLAYASRALSTTEVGYAQIEKECLPIVFSLERFHQYTFGRNTIVNTDHKPLETIVKKHCGKHTNESKECVTNFKCIPSVVNTMNCVGL